MAEVIQIIAVGTGKLLLVQAITLAVAFPILIGIADRKKLRLAVMLIVLALEHVALFYVLDRRTVLLMGVVFFWLQFGYAFRYLSALYYYRGGHALPRFGFYFAHVLWGPRQHYGAGDWQGLAGERFGGKLLREWLKHWAYTLAVVAIAALLFRSRLLLNPPWDDIVLRGVAFILGLEILTQCANFQSLVWSTRGLHAFWFGNFAWFKSKHIGQFWQRWNQFAILAFREMSRIMRLGRRRFLNTVAVFAVSGVLHQLMVSYYTRELSYGTILSFLIHGVLVYAFNALYRARKKIPAPLRVVAFNPLTNAVVVLLASQPFVMDFYGTFAIRF